VVAVTSLLGAAVASQVGCYDSVVFAQDRDVFLEIEGGAGVAVELR
jgi:hypothetical protein